jgi:hypothetical protein
LASVGISIPVWDLELWNICWKAREGSGGVILEIQKQQPSVPVPEGSTWDYTVTNSSPAPTVKANKATRITGKKDRAKGSILLPPLKAALFYPCWV